MADILYDANKLKVYENLKAICAFCRESDEERDRLWLDLLTDRELYEEMVYYQSHHCLTENVKFQGYTLIDLYVWQMNRSNLKRDTGKNTAECNKEHMVIKAFQTMAAMKKDPETYARRLAEGQGMDVWIE